MNNTRLCDGVGEGGFDGLGEAFEAVAACYEHVADASGLSSLTTFSQNFAPSFCSIQMPPATTWFTTQTCRVVGGNGRSLRPITKNNRASSYAGKKISHIGHVRKMSLVNAKTHLSKLVDLAEHRGQRILILRHGSPPL